MRTSDAIFEEIKQAIEDRNHARTALHEVRAMRNATEDMIEAAHAAYAATIRNLDALNVAFEEALSAEEAAIAFDVSGTVTLNDVMVPIGRETYEQRVLRLAMKAVIKGCEIVHSNTMAAYVTSASTPGKTYWVGIDQQRGRCACECDGFKNSKRGDKMCTHLALVLVRRGIVTAPEMATTEAIAA